MKGVLRAALAVGLVAGFAPPVAEARGSATLFMPPEQHRPTDAEAIRSLVEESTRAWNAGDAAAYVARFAIDVEFTDVTGSSSTGRKLFEARQDQLFKTIFRGSRLKQTIRQVRLLASDVALVEIETELTGYAGLPRGVKAWPDGVFRTRLQVVLVKVAGAWWISGYHDVDAKIPEFHG